MSAHGGRLRLRLFLEGVEVPVIGAQLQCLPNAPVMAAIQVPPLAEGMRILPRTLVHLYFLDFYEEQSPFISTSAPGTTTTQERNPTAYEQAQQDRFNQAVDEGSQTPLESRDAQTDTQNERYKLMFCGEILGFEWTKNAQGQRSLVLQCADLSNYWDYAYQWTNTGLFGPGIKALFSGGSTNLFTDFLSSKAEALIGVLNTPSITFPKLKGLAGGIIHLLEAIGGNYYYDKKIAGQNIFFTLAELRLHLTQMIAAVEDDPTASRLLSVNGYGGLFSRMLGGLGGQVSIRKSISALSGVIFHEMYAQPCPLYQPGLGGTVGGAVRVKVSENPKTRFISFASELVRRNLEDIKSQLNIQDERPELALEALQNRETLGSLRAGITTRLKRMRQLLQSAVMQLRKVNVPAAGSLLNTASQKIGQASTITQKSWRPGDDKSITKITDLLDDAIDRLRRASELTISSTPKKQIQPARLNQQILRPDVWFSAPPRCNVIFPEHFWQLSYRRSYMEEPTRLLLKTNDEFFGEDELFDRFYFAPKTRSVKKGKATLTSLLRNDLLEHELLTGILPVFEKMGELNIFAARGGVVKDKVPQVGLAQRSANFIYFKYRFAARQMIVSGRFNPYLACGFPAVVIDRYVDLESLRLHNELLQKLGRPTRDINKLLGTAFLGNLTQVTHSVNQENGSTELVLTYPRLPDEGVEFLGATDKEEVTVSKRFEEDVRRITDVAALNPPKVQSVGPNMGRVTRVQEVTDLYRGTGEGLNALSTKPLLIFGSDKSQKPRPASKRYYARVPVGTNVDAKKLDKRVQEELGLVKGDTNQFAGTTINRERQNLQVVRIKAYRVEEEVPRYRQEVVELPAEEYIRPGWYGDVWHPAQIGKAYETFFRTGAITDPHQISDPQGSSFSATNNAADEAMADAQGADVDNPQKDAPLVYALNEGASIEQAVAFLLATYAHIKQNGLDVEEFIRAYTWRPIASMIDMFGTSDLQLSADGSQVIQGIEGFHSRAFGQFNDLFGLVTPEIEEVVGLKRGTTAATRGDTRKVKQDAVRDFVGALGFARAIVG